VKPIYNDNYGSNVHMVHKAQRENMSERLRMSKKKLCQNLDVTKHHWTSSLVLPNKTSSSEKTPSSEEPSCTSAIVQSKADSSKAGIGAVRDYIYMDARYLLDPAQGTPADWACMDTGSGTSMIDSMLCWMVSAVYSDVAMQANIVIIQFDYAMICMDSGIKMLEQILSASINLFLRCRNRCMADRGKGARCVEILTLKLDSFTIEL